MKGKIAKATVLLTVALFQRRPVGECLAPLWLLEDRLEAKSNVTIQKRRRVVRAVGVATKHLFL
jgi:hypothetical protein